MWNNTGHVLVTVASGSGGRQTEGSSGLWDGWSQLPRPPHAPQHFSQGWELYTGRGSATCFILMAYVVPVSTRGFPLSLNSSLCYMTSTQEAVFSGNSHFILIFLLYTFIKWHNESHDWSDCNGDEKSNPKVLNPVEGIPVGVGRVLRVGRLARGVREVVGGDVLQCFISRRIVCTFPVTHNL